MNDDESTKNIDEGNNQPQPQLESQNSQQPTRYDGVSIAGLVLAFLLPPLGLILSIIGLIRTSKNGTRGQVLAIAGLGLSILNMIIGILLIALTLTAFSNVQSRARDAERKNDINALYAELELYYNNNKYYPASLDVLAQSQTSAKSFTTPPKNSTAGAYYYTPEPAGCTQCASYVVGTKLENPTNSGAVIYEKESLTQ